MYIFRDYLLSKNNEQIDNETIYGCSLARITLAYNHLLDLEHNLTLLESQPLGSVPKIQQ